MPMISRMSPWWLLVLLLPALVSLPANACNLPFEPTLADALKKATLRGQPVLVVVTGSDWSPRSVKLDKELLEHQEVEGLIERSFVPLLVDFPQRVRLPESQGLANRAFAEKYQVRHFPTLLALDSSGQEIGRLSFQQASPAELMSILRQWLGQPEDGPELKSAQ